MDTDFLYVKIVYVAVRQTFTLQIRAKKLGIGKFRRYLWIYFESEFLVKNFGEWRTAKTIEKSTLD